MAQEKQLDHGREPFTIGLPSNVGDVIFFVALGVWSVASLLCGYTYFKGVVAPVVPLVWIRWACLAVIVARELLTARWTRKYFLTLALFATLAVIGMQAKYPFFPEAAAFVLAGRNVPFKRVALFVLAALAAAVLAALLGSLAGVTHDFVFKGKPLPCHTLGFLWPDTAGSVFFFALCLWAAARGGRLRYPEVAGMAALAGLAFLATGSRAALVLSALLVAFLLAAKLLRLRMPKGRAPGLACAGVFALIAAGSVLLALLYDPAAPWMSALNDLLANRLERAHAVLAKYGVTALGAKVPYGSTNVYSAAGKLVAGKTALLVDCLYPKLLVHCGALFYALVVALGAMVVYRSASAGNHVLTAALLAVAAFSLYEAYAIYPFMNAFAFLAGALFSDPKPPAPELPGDEPQADSGMRADYGQRSGYGQGANYGQRSGYGQSANYGQRADSGTRAGYGQRADYGRRADYEQRAERGQRAGYGQQAEAGRERSANTRRASGTGYTFDASRASGAGYASDARRTSGAGYTPGAGYASATRQASDTNRASDARPYEAQLPANRSGRKSKHRGKHAR